MKKLVLLLVLGIPMLVWCQGYELPMTSVKDHPYKYKAYTVLFNTTTNIPRWVAWTYSKKKKSNIQLPRGRNVLKPDPNLGQASPPDAAYTGSGYDRGHMCPANDCLWNGQALLESSYATNFCPQSPALNRSMGRKGKGGSAWPIVEDKCHSLWVEHYDVLYIVAGPIPGEMQGTILFGEGKSILVPKRFFKAIVGARKGSYHGIGFVFTQDGEVEIVSIDEVERLARLDLFCNLPKRIQEKVESVSSFSESDWPDLKVIKMSERKR